MPFYLMHAGTALQKVSTSGSFYTLSLPGGVTLVSTRRARFALLDRWIIVTNAVSRNIKFDAADLSASLLNIAAPAAALTAAAGAAGDLDGEYRWVFTYAIKAGGVVICESPFSPVSDPLTLSSQQADLSNVTVSPTSGVNCRRIYRTTNGGSEYYLAGEIDDNTATTATDATSDYDLALVSAVNDLGNPPGTDDTDRLRLITSWKDRLWGAGDTNASRDFVYFSGNRKVWGWNGNNVLAIKPVGEDEYGVTGFMARRDELGITKRRALWKVIGNSPDDYQLIKVAEGVGGVSSDAAIVVRDRGYFLGEDGFYEWGPEGVKSLTHDTVHPWFTTDTYFNRALFGSAFAKWNPLFDTIELHLAAAGSSAIDRWVSYDIRRGFWLGPHKTDAFTPTFGGLMNDANDIPVPMLASSDGYLYRQNAGTFNDDATAIALDVQTAFHSMDTPDIDKYFGELAVIAREESAGTLVVTPSVGDLDASAGAAIAHVLSGVGRRRHRRLGTGRFVQLRFQNGESGQRVEIYGYEIPFHELGRR